MYPNTAKTLRYQQTGARREYTHTFTHSHTHTRARAHARTHARTHSQTHTRTHARTYIHTHAHARTHARTHTSKIPKPTNSKNRIILRLSRDLFYIIIFFPLKCQTLAPNIPQLKICGFQRVIVQRPRPPWEHPGVTLEVVWIQ